jgi:hypothetical protein
MNKSVVIIAVIALLGVVGIGGYVMVSKNSTRSNVNTPETTTTQSSKRAPNEKMSLKELLGIKEPQQCQFTDTKTESSGTVYIADQQFRGDFENTVNETAIQSHMIVSNNMAYVWTEGQDKGFKMEINTILNADNSKKDSMKQSTVDLTQTLEYSCVGWNKDIAKFSVPTTVTFTDYTEMMQNALNPQNPQGSMQRTKVNCSVCESLQGQAQAQCKASLGCQ